MSKWMIARGDFSFSTLQSRSTFGRLQLSNTDRETHMTLIPSESHSFPDSFSPVASQRKNKTTARATGSKPVAPQSRKTQSVAAKRTLAPLPKRNPAPPNALAKSSDDQNKSVVPETRPPSAPAVSLKTVSPSLKQRAKIDNRPVQPSDVETIDDLQSDLFAAETAAQARRKWRRKLNRFVIFELCAFALLASSAWLVLSKTVIDPNAVFFLNILTIASAFAAVMIPIISFAIAPALSRKQY